MRAGGGRLTRVRQRTEKLFEIRSAIRYANQMLRDGERHARVMGKVRGHGMHVHAGERGSRATRWPRGSLRKYQRSRGRSGCDSDEASGGRRGRVPSEWTGSRMWAALAA